jgi:hypothetical protein
VTRLIQAVDCLCRAHSRSILSSLPFFIYVNASDTLEKMNPAPSPQPSKPPPPASVSSQHPLSTRSSNFDTIHYDSSPRPSSVSSSDHADPNRPPHSSNTCWSYSRSELQGPSFILWIDSSRNWYYAITTHTQEASANSI